MDFEQNANSSVAEVDQNHNTQTNTFIDSSDISSIALTNITQVNIGGSSFLPSYGKTRKSNDIMDESQQVTKSQFPPNGVIHEKLRKKGHEVSLNPTLLKTQISTATNLTLSSQVSVGISSQISVGTFNLEHEGDLDEQFNQICDHEKHTSYPQGFTSTSENKVSWNQMMKENQIILKLSDPFPVGF